MQLWESLKLLSLCLMLKPEDTEQAILNARELQSEEQQRQAAIHESELELMSTSCLEPTRTYWVPVSSHCLRLDELHVLQ